MTLTERIQQLRKDRERLEGEIKDARRRYWDAEFIRKNDARRENESETEWHRRRHRNRQRAHRKQEVVDLLVKKKDAVEHEIKVLQDAKDDLHIPNPDPDGDNWGSFDGKMVASWMVGENPEKRNYLAEARASGLWSGYIISGGRTPAYSTWLCQQQCDHPTCPGTCAGAGSNHASNDGFPLPINGAIDVSDPYGFEQAMAHIGCHYLINDLPLDANHFSPSGH